MLLFTLIFGIWSARVIVQARQQRAAATSVRDSGGRVRYEHEFRVGPQPGPLGDFRSIPTWGVPLAGRTPRAPQWLRRICGDEPFQKVVMVEWSSSSPSRGNTKATAGTTLDAALERVSALGSVRTILIFGPTVTDAGMRSIGRMTSLEEVAIFPADRITDAGVEALGGIRSLRILYVQFAQLTGVGLQALGKLPNLEQIMINGPSFTDAGLAALGDSSHLRFLWVQGGPPRPGQPTITDAGVAAVTGLTALEVLRLNGGGITDGAVDSLLKLPKLQELRLFDTQISRVGRRRLQVWKPELRGLTSLDEHQ